MIEQRAGVEGCVSCQRCILDGPAYHFIPFSALHDDILHTKDVVARPIPASRPEASGITSSRVTDGFGLPTSFLAGLKDTVGLSSKDAAKSKYSEKVIKTLEAKLRAIAKGEDNR
jgi:hypothetical protein